MAKSSKNNTLERILHKQGHGSRKLCRIMIINDEVTVNGELCDDPSEKFALEGMEYTVRGEAWTYQEKSYLMLHKPGNYECSHKTQHHPTIYSLLPHPLVERGVQCIGRLDEDTTGLIIISDDGQFIHKVSSPKHHVPKVYAVTCKHPVQQSDIDALLAGVKLIDEEQTIAALAVKPISEHVIHMTLAEGKTGTFYINAHLYEEDNDTWGDGDDDMGSDSKTIKLQEIGSKPKTVYLTFRDEGDKAEVKITVTRRLKIEEY